MLKEYLAVALKALKLGALGGGFVQHERGLKHRVDVDKPARAVKQLLSEHMRMPRAESVDAPAAAEGVAH